MPALILFGSAVGTASPGAASRAERLRVKEDAAAVVKKLNAAKGGFVQFAPSGSPRTKVWVNRDQVRLVRPA